ncbi:hypothetical protein TNCV_2562641 [Trichonephila clavipes]|uniref:Uncharacterized protein n=1 Tax=Trichonephila clavipes TaxID=2585209 RepID=A0A8X6R1E6_TRICX|nr:hypothetical protein TNCV_2562641 [Trichonephila clavipes]
MSSGREKEIERGESEERKERERRERRDREREERERERREREEREIEREFRDSPKFTVLQKESLSLLKRPCSADSQCVKTKLTIVNRLRIKKLGT